MQNKKEFLNFYKNALNRLSADERALENFSSNGAQSNFNYINFNYKFSLYALAKYFFNLKLNFNDTRPVIIAVSGGGDSVALLWLMRAFFSSEIIAAHVNHCIRGAEADIDENFVKDIAEKRFGVKFISAKINVPELRQNGESIEEAARRLRHEWLIKTAEKFNAGGIALGHNKDDLAETVLFNILRGTGIRGSIGIPERRGLFFRPLLGLRREFLRDILRIRNIPWREDSTNNDINASARNFIRLELLPLINEKINSGAIEHLANFGEEMRTLRDDEERRGEFLFNDLLILCDKNFIILNRDKIRNLNKFEINLVIREAGRRMGVKTLSRRRTLELAELIKKYKNNNSFIFQWQSNFIVKYSDNGLCFMFAQF